MIEPALVTLIVGVVGSGGLVGALKIVVDAFGKKSKEPISTSEAEASSFHSSLQIFASQTDAFRQELNAEREAREKMAEEIEELQIAKAEDRHTITTLRYGMQLLMAWGDDLRLRWDEHRLKEEPPDMPPINFD